jgi:exodeoxyribonuclease VII large subunit
MFLNDFELAKMIATMPIAVMTGIGHERDNTILDEVAHTSLDTPSKVIGYIFEQILVQTQQAKHDWKVIRYMAQQRHAQQQQRITHHMMHIRQDARQHITHHRQSITHATHRLTRHALSIVQQERQRAIHFKQSLTPSALSYATRHRLNINHWHQLVLNMHPHRLLNMGYTLLHNEHDRVITHYQDAIQEKRLRIEFHDGSVWATIEHPDP